MHKRTSLVAVGVVALGIAAPSVMAQSNPDYDFDFVTIGAPGSAPYTGDSPFGPPMAFGRGSVPYEYRIGRTEVTTSQWLEFVNTFTMRADYGFGLELLPTFWGAMRDWDYKGPGFRWMLHPGVEFAAMLPVQDISWRQGARFCNWLHSNKGPSFAALVTGAYDTTTWGNDGGQFTDDANHLPGARFWIPSLDEWMKAVHHDPDRYADAQEGWWLYPNGTDEPLVAGPPGVGQTTAGYQPGGFGGAEWKVPLGSYPDSVSPWGLLDASGGAREWTEHVFWPGEQYERGLAGSMAGRQGSHDSWLFDHVSTYGSAHPDVSQGGLRLAPAVPAPGTLWLLGGMLWSPRRARRREQHLTSRARTPLCLFANVPGAALAVVVLSPPCARGQALPDYDFQWSTIGSPGNRAANAQEAPELFNEGLYPGGLHLGAVAHEYRMARTEVTASQWFEFVQAFAPRYPGPSVNSSYGSFASVLTGQWIAPVPGSGHNGQPWQFTMDPEAANLATGTSWHFAARYANWLHNGKSPEQWAFETGVYDTATFTRNPDGTWNDQFTPAPGARFWLPTLDEWTKGMYYDPNRHGDGQEGYWAHPIGHDTPAVPGYPEDGGETSAGTPFPPDFDASWHVPVGAYPHISSPWGLLDGSGSGPAAEWTTSGSERGRWVRGSGQFGGDTSLLYDEIDRLGAGGLSGGGGAFRLASAVPAPASILLFCVGVPYLIMRRR